MSTIQEALEPLTRCTSTDEVAALLRAHEIKGHRGNGASCPITRFLRRQSGIPSVHTTRAYACPSGWVGPDAVRLPPVVQAFVYQFDGGQFADLREEGLV